MASEMRSAVFILLGLIAGMALGLWLHGCESRTEVSQVEVVRCDTLSRVDTVREVEPVPVLSAVVRIDTVWLEAVQSPESRVQRDTVVVHDSVRVVVPIEQKIYADTSYTAWVSGFRPSLDSIEVYNRTVEVTRTVETTRTIEVPRLKRWGLGVTAGYGWSPKGFTPYVGVGVTYNIIGF